MNTLQHQYDLIYSFFKTTTESFDELYWNGLTLQVIQNNITIEEYSFLDLKDIIPQLN